MKYINFPAPLSESIFLNSHLITTSKFPNHYIYAVIDVPKILFIQNKALSALSILSIYYQKSSRNSWKRHSDISKNTEPYLS